MHWRSGKKIVGGDKQSIVLIGLVWGLSFSLSQAQTIYTSAHTPEFSEFHVNVDPKKMVNEPDFSHTSFPPDEEMKSHFKDIEKQYRANSKPNFSGHYVVTNYSCGRSCFTVAMVDTRTGAITMFAGYVWIKEDPAYNNPISYCINSSLIIFRGTNRPDLLDHLLPIASSHYYDIDGDNKSGAPLDIAAVREQDKTDRRVVPAWSKKYRSDPALCDPGMAPLK